MDVEISPVEIRKMGEEMKKIASDMINDLNEITERVNMIPDNFRGQGCDMIMQKYSALKAHFNDFYDKANECSDHLIKSANTAIKTDVALQKVLNENF